MPNKIDNKVVDKMWGLLVKHSGIKLNHIMNFNMGAGKFVFEKPSFTKISYVDLADFETNRLSRLVENEISKGLNSEISLYNSRNKFNVSTYENLDGAIGVVNSSSLKGLINNWKPLNMKSGAFMIVIAPLENETLVDGLVGVENNMMLYDAFGEGISGQLVIKKI
jgi:hypothetical protein